ncbi:MAG: hypothetical protein ACE5F1_19970 [Planctomycetota bacterium]
MATAFHRVCDQNGWDHKPGSAVVPLPDGRKQKVFVEVVEDGGEELLRIYTVVGDASILDEIRMQAALKINFRMRHGALAIMDQKLVILDTFPAEGADEEVLQDSAEYMAKRADDYEKYIYRIDVH